MRRITAVLLLILVSLGASIGLGTTVAGAAPSCGSACYVNGTTGSDSNAGTVSAPLATIQAALDAVSPGGTVYVAAGTYDQNLTISQAVTLDGANAGVNANSHTRGTESVLQQTTVTDPSTSLIDVTTPAQVTIDGFSADLPTTPTDGNAVGNLLYDTNTENDLTFQNNIVSGAQFANTLLYDTSAANSTILDNLFTGETQTCPSGPGCGTGIIADWGYITDNTPVNLDIQGNTFANLDDTDGVPALNINTASGTIADNTFSNLQNYGILLGDNLTGLTVSGNTFDGITNQTPGSSSNRGSAIFLYSPYFVGTVSVTQNTFTDAYHAIRSANYEGAQTVNANFSATYNDFTGPFNGGGTGVDATNSTAISTPNLTGPFNATCNWWGQGTGANADQLDGTATVATSPYLGAASPLTSGNCGVWNTYVNAATGSDSNPGTLAAPFATVQAGINAVSAGGTVHVAAGTYAESLSITKSVSLLGANAGVSGTGARGPESTVIQTAGTSGVFNITTPDPVTIDGFTGTFTGTAAGGQVTVGGLLDDTQTNNNLTFENNVVAGSTFNNALLYDTSALNSTIANNLFTGTGQIGAGATGIIGAWGSGSHQANLSITGNTFTGLTETTADGTPAININDAGGTVAGNTFTNLHQYGILLADTLANLAITGNTFSGVYNSTPGTSSNRGSGVRTYSNPTFAGPVTVSLNTFTNMYHAVDVANDGTPADLTSGNFTVNRNSFIGPFTGAGTGAGATDSTAINVASGTVGTLNATCNWWGGIPTPNQLSGSATVSPYLFAASPLATAACGVNTNTSTITSAPSVQVASGKNVKFTVTTHGNPTATLSVVGLPAGLTFTPGTGPRAGTAKLGGSGLASGDYTLTFHANNGVGPDTTQVFTVHVLGITSTASYSFSRSGPPTQSFTVTTTGAGAGVTLSSTLGGKQAGLSFHDNGDGTATIFGTPSAAARTGTIKVTARTGAAITTQKLAIGIDA